MNASFTTVAQALLDKARATGNAKIEAMLTDERSMLPSIEELKAELGGDFFEQGCNAVIVHDTNHGST